MDIFRCIQRNVRVSRTTTTNPCYRIIGNLVGDDNNDFVLYDIYSTSVLVNSIIEVINGERSSCQMPPSLLNCTWNVDGDDFVFIDVSLRVIIVKITRSQIASRIPNSIVPEIMEELKNIFTSIVRNGRMPARYRERTIDPAQYIEMERIRSDDSTPRKLKNTMVDDIPDDVFTMETIIDRIRNCGSVSNAKEVPVIIRFNDKKLMITDTSIEKGFLYFDVIEVPKKEIDYPSIKFSDYIDFSPEDVVRTFETLARSGPLTSNITREPDF